MQRLSDVPMEGIHAGWSAVVRQSWLAPPSIQAVPRSTAAAAAAAVVVVVVVCVQWSLGVLQTCVEKHPALPFAGGQSDAAPKLLSNI